MTERDLTGDVDVRLLTPSDEAELTELFAANTGTEVTQWFDPFPLTPQQAHDLTHHEGRDLFWAIVREGRIVGLYMVRGWDAGHPHRALGVFIDEREQGAMVGLRAGYIVAQHLRSIGERTLRGNVHAKNGRVLHLAALGGFTEVERRGDRVILELRLDNPASYPAGTDTDGDRPGPGA